MSTLRIQIYSPERKFKALNMTRHSSLAFSWSILYIMRVGKINLRTLSKMRNPWREWPRRNKEEFQEMIFSHQWIGMHTLKVSKAAGGETKALCQGSCESELTKWGKKMKSFCLNLLTNKRRIAFVKYAWCDY